MAGNDVEWTSEQMIENANSWSLAGDVALLNRLKKFSESLLSETISVSANVDNLLNNLENVSLKLDLTKNEFQSLRNTQFIENRVYEDDETMENNEEKKEETELTEEEKQNAIRESIVKGLKVMEKYFEKIEVPVSDSEEEENEKSYILQPKDPYADRPLPCLVGSQEWYRKWHVGLLPSESESESEKEDEVYSSSDSEKSLPKDVISGSETSSELSFTNKNSGPVASSTFNDSQNRRETFYSPDGSFEQSSSLPAKAPISDKNLAEQLTAKLDKIINNTAENLEHVNKNPIKKMNQKTKYGDLFSDEPPPLDDPVLTKSAHEGLFSGGRDLFADSNDDDLLWDQQNRTSQNIKSSEEKEHLFSPSSQKSTSEVSKGLFDNSDSSSEEDMFDVAEKRKVKIAQPYLKPFKSTVPFVDDQPPDITPKSENVPSKKKPIGGVSIFGENANIFGENSGKPGFENTKSTAVSQITQQAETKPSETVKKSLKKESLFDESSDDDVTTPRNVNVVDEKPEKLQAVKKLSLFDDTNDILSPKTQETLKKTEEKKKLSLFDDEDDVPPIQKEDSKETKKSNLFTEDSDQNTDLFRPTTKETAHKTETLNKTSTENKKTRKKISLFDDDDDFLNEEDEIFSNVPKKKGLFDNIEEKPGKKPLKGLFEDVETSDTLSKTPANAETQYKKPKGLFDDLEANYSSENRSENSKTADEEKNKDAGKQMLGEKKIMQKFTKMLFDDLESSGSTDNLSDGFEKEADTRSSEIEENLKKDITSQREGSKQGTESVFEGTETTSLPETSKKEDADVKSLGKRGDVVEDGNITLNVDKNNENPIKQNKTSLFEDSDNDDLFRTVNSEVVKEKSAKLPKSDVVKDKNDVAEKKSQQDVQKKKENIEQKHIEEKETSELAESRKDTSGQSEGVLKQSKNDVLGKIRKNVGFLDSDGEGFSDDFVFDEKAKNYKESDSDRKNTLEGDSKDFKEETLFEGEEPKTLGFEEKGDVESSAGFSNISTGRFEPDVNITESSPKHEVPHSNISENYTIPPPLDLFDPNPPPPDPDWDIASDNSGESDTFSLTDGILDRSNLIQSQTRSSLFDEAPPSLDVNESSGIVRDLNATRVETDESSFYPYASSSRRLSSDIFGEQQSQDSFFVTNNRIEPSTQPGGSLGKIPENIEDMSSKIENLTPSGNIEDFEGSSSVFERSENEPKNSEIMDNSGSISEIPKKSPNVVPFFEKRMEDAQDGDIIGSKIPVNVKKSTDLFERNKSPENRADVDKKPISPIKTSPGKLKHNLNINVSALMPGAARPKIGPPVAKSPSSDEPDNSIMSSPPKSDASSESPLISPVTKPRSGIFGNADAATALGDDKFENVSQTEVLSSATKDRVRIPIKRKPSTRRARQEAVRKSVTDFSLYHTEENSSLDNVKSPENDKVIPKSPSDDKDSFLKDLNDKLRIHDGASKKETLENEDSAKSNESTPEVKGTSLVFNEESREQPVDSEKIVKNPVSRGLFDSSLEETDDFFNPASTTEDTEDTSVSVEISESEYKNNVKSISGVSKSLDILKSESVQPIEKEHKNESDELNADVASNASVTSKEEQKYEPKSIFEDSFEDSSNIFKTTSKLAPISSEISRKPKKESSIFGSGGSDSDEDLFSSTTKSFKKDASSVNILSKLEEIPSKQDPKPSIFSEKSDSEGDSELSGGKSKTPATKVGKKMVGETSKKTSIFDDLDDSSEEDLFGSKTSKSRSGSGDFSENTGSILSTRRAESRNVKMANVKKLENKEVTDFDPLSALK